MTTIIVSEKDLYGNTIRTYNYNIISVQEMVDNEKAKKEQEEREAQEKEYLMKIYGPDFSGFDPYEELMKEATA